MEPELIELNRIRLDETKTYAELAAEIGLSEHSGLYRLLNGVTEPRDTTLHKIRRFLEARNAAQRQHETQRKSRRKVS